MRWKSKHLTPLSTRFFRCSQMISSARLFPLLVVIASVSALVIFLIPIKKPIGFICPSNHERREKTTHCVCTTDDQFLLAPQISRQLFTDQLFTDNFGPNPASLRCVMTVMARGRLGNLMGEYATLIALSKFNNRNPVILPEMAESLRDYFDLSVPMLGKEIANNVPWTIREINDWMLPEYSRLNGTFVKIKGYPCSWTFFHHLRDQIKKEFTFKSYIIKDAQIQLRKYRGDRKTPTYIGVHVRRGDYVKLMQTLYDGVIADVDYLNSAMNYYRNKYSDCIFVVCSDDLYWCQQNLNNSRNDIYFGWDGLGRSPGYDMALLTQCNHSVMSIGTFGFWSSYLTGGEVVYLNNYTRSGSKFHKVFHYDAAYLPEWVGLSANLDKCLHCSKNYYARFLPYYSYNIFIVLLQVYISIRLCA